MYKKSPLDRELYSHLCIHFEFPLSLMLRRKKEQKIKSLAKLYESESLLL